MRNTIVVAAILGLSLTAGLLHAQASEPNSPCCQTEIEDPNSVEAILNRLEAEAAGLTSYQCQIDYVFLQTLLESQSRQKGTLYYARFEEQSYLRVDFDTIQYDEEKPLKHKEQFFFDGVWVTYIDHRNKSAHRQQMAEPNKPVDAFSLVSRRVPVLGFSQTENLQEQFDIELASEKASAPSASSLLHMTVKPGSIYEDDYTTVDFHVGKDHGLPIQIEAVTLEEDVHRITLVDPKINKRIHKSRFDVKIPDDFSVETTPLARTGVPQ